MAGCAGRRPADEARGQAVVTQRFGFSPGIQAVMILCTQAFRSPSGAADCAADAPAVTSKAIQPTHRTSFGLRMTMTPGWIAWARTVLLRASRGTGVCRHSSSLRTLATCRKPGIYFGVFDSGKFREWVFQSRFLEVQQFDIEDQHAVRCPGAVGLSYAGLSGIHTRSLSPVTISGTTSCRQQHADGAWRCGRICGCFIGIGRTTGQQQTQGGE